MLIKLDIRSARVKGVCFHKSRPWVLCGLHSGIAQIWDYHMNVLVDTYSEHGGAVRGVDFHVTQPLFCTGSDDQSIKVWNYVNRRCLYTLTGHMDYIRTTFFHEEQPWIISSSDDYTVRIWNWQSRICIANLPAHHHYVMCARFHPTKELVVSCSLDKTIRVWDISHLRFRKQESGITQDLLGSSDIQVICQGEHLKGVNWVDIHPTNSRIASASDDQTIVVWNLSDGFISKKTVIREHTDNVVCVTFMKDYIVSCGEDRTVRVFVTGDVFGGYETISLLRRDMDRFWILSTLPAKNLIVAGHDTGLQVFKLFRERPPFLVIGDEVNYLYETTWYKYNAQTNETIKTGIPRKFRPPTAISRNPVDDRVCVSYSRPGEVSEVFSLPKPGFTTSPSDVLKLHNAVSDAVFFGPNKLAYVAKNGELTSFSLGDNKEKCLPTAFKCLAVFHGPPGCILCQSEHAMHLYQVAQHSAVASVDVKDVKQAIWNKDYQKLALITKNSITVLTKRFKVITTIAETSARIKSAAFDDTRDILYYTTSNHLKYCFLRNGEFSTITTVKVPIYLMRAEGDKIWMVTRGGLCVTKELDALELNFKFKLHQQSFRDVLKIIQSNKLKGQALVGYLHKHGYSEIALYFAKDPLTRFYLAVECGVLHTAKEAAEQLNDPAVWRRLADTAVNFGDIQLSQLCNAKAGNYYTSALQALLTGNTSVIASLVDTSTDDNFKLQYGLYLEDFQQRIQLLLRAGQLPLAYLTAKSHGLTEVAESIKSKMDPSVAKNIDETEVFPHTGEPTPTPMTDNWPMLEMQESVFMRFLREPAQFELLAHEDAALEDNAGTAWDDEDDNDHVGDGSDNEFEEAKGSEGGADEDGWEDNLDIDVESVLKTTEGSNSDAGFVVPPTLPSPSSHWKENSNIAAYHVAAGSFATALDLLRSQIGLVNPAPLREQMLLLWASVNFSRPAALTASAPFPVSAIGGSMGGVMPLLPFRNFQESLRVGYQLFVEGRFVDAHAAFRGILLQSVLSIVQSDEEKSVLREVQNVAAEYARALGVQLQLRSVEGSSVEALQLALYFTHFRLQRPHLALALAQAMSKAYKKKNLITAARVARRLLELEPPKNKAQQAAAIIAEADKNPTDAVQLDYDDRNPYTLCSESYKPMYKGTVDFIRCSFCLSPANPNYKGKACSVCTIAQYGAESAGLQNQI